MNINLTAEEMQTIEHALIAVQLDNQDKLVTKQFSDEYALEVIAKARRHNDILNSVFSKNMQARRDAK